MIKNVLTLFLAGRRKENAITEPKKMIALIRKTDENALAYSSKTLLNNGSFMLSVVKMVGDGALLYASDALKNNKEFMYNCLLLCDESTMFFASDELKKNESFVLETIRIKGCGVLLYVDACLQQNIDFLMKVVVISDEKLLDVIPESVRHSLMKKILSDKGYYGMPVWVRDKILSYQQLSACYTNIRKGKK